MELTINIENKKMYDSFVQLFKSIGVKIVSFASAEKESVKQHKKKSPPDEKDFFEICGIWKNRDLSKEKLRKMAWRNA